MEEKKTMPDEELEQEKVKQGAEEQVESEIEQLRRQNKELTRALEERKSISGRLEAEISEFSEMFPDVPLAQIPEDIWAEVKAGLPLSASYARHERRRTLAEQSVEKANNAAREGSSGSVTSSPDYYFTADEVRKMSASEVKKNYSKIINSMKKWN
ncbi:MAG: hypothetical protein IJ303_02105 [Clostridia bacterium]|nr:hypothetical protein [Clostridia bacterium]